MGESPSEARELIAAARAGDRAATGRLLARYRTYLAQLARMSLRRDLRAKFDASDVVQDALVKAQERFGGFRGASEEAMVAWLRQILRRSMMDADRRFRGNDGRSIAREQRYDDLLLGSSQGARRAPVAKGTSPSRGAQRRETRTCVKDALALLRPDDREVILLRSFDELEWTEVARRMERTPDAVRMLWGRAFRRLGALVKERRWTAP